MNETTILVIGIALRVAIPILLTALLVAYLRSLDARWQAEARARVGKEVDEGQMPCYEVKGCSAEQMAHCAALKSDEPCWQVKRKLTGEMSNQCLSCEVFRTAPVPAIHHI